MTIKILSTRLQTADGANIARHTNLIISDGAFPDATHYALGRGGLPLTGNLQAILEAEEASLWRVAVAKNNSLTAEEVRLECYNSPSAGGWDRNEFQEAWFEARRGDSTKANILDDKREAIRAEWPLIKKK